MDVTGHNARRIRQRMADDARVQVKLLRSEIENYGEHFYPGELQKIREIIKRYEGLSSSLDKVD